MSDHRDQADPRIADLTSSEQPARRLVNILDSITISEPELRAILVKVISEPDNRPMKMFGSLLAYTRHVGTPREKAIADMLTNVLESVLKLIGEGK